MRFWLTAAAALTPAHVAGEMFRAHPPPPPPDDYHPLGRFGQAITGMSLQQPPGMTLMARQASDCPVACSGGCCPVGDKCCTEFCCPLETECRPDFDGCCPENAVTCGGRLCSHEGSICCGDSVCFEGTVCNLKGSSPICCEEEKVPCNGGCCPPGSECSDEPGYCFIPKSTTRSTSTRTTSSARPTETGCKPGAAKRGFEHDAEVQRRQNLQGNCVYECHNGKLIPVVEVPNLPGQTDELFASMCAGILSTSKGRAGDGSSTDVLTYRGSSGKRQRRSQAKCSGYCKQQKAVFADPATLQCDEYPPAMAGEGGSGAHRTCISQSQNSGSQGKLFREFVRGCSPGKGKQFMVRMKGGCNFRNGKRDETIPVPRIESRDDSDNSLRFNATSDLYFSWGNMSYVYVPLEGLRNGHYKFDIQFKGRVGGIQILDSDGEEYFASNAVSDGHVAEFDIQGAADSDDEALPAGLFLDVEDKIEVTYSAEATLNVTKDSMAAGVYAPGCAAAAGLLGAVLFAMFV